LTLCLLAIIVAFAWPSLDGPFASQRLRRSADRVRARWCEARADAMNTGQTHVFRYSTDDGRYTVSQFAESEATIDPSTGFALDVGVQSSDMNAENKVERLPEGVTFGQGETMLDSRAWALGEGDGASESINPVENQLDTSEFTNSILFYPDGTTSTTAVVLKNDRDECIELRLRGMTGVVNVSGLTTMEALSLDGGGTIP